MAKAIPKPGLKKIPENARILPKYSRKPRSIDAPKLGRPEKYTPEWIEEEAVILREWVENDGGMYIGSFARERGYHRQRISEFVKVSKNFSDAYREAMQWQEEKFMRNALTRTWDPGFTARCMARVCGDEWKNSFDKEESDKEVVLNITVNEIKK